MYLRDVVDIQRHSDSYLSVAPVLLREVYKLLFMEKAVSGSLALQRVVLIFR